MTMFGKWSDLDVARHNAKVQRKQVLDESAAIDTERESDLHDQIMAECKRRGWLVVHSRMDMMTTIAKGTPDFVIFADKSRVIICECKTGRGKLTMDQAAWIIMAEKLGHRVSVIRSLEQFLTLL